MFQPPTHFPQCAAMQRHFADILAECRALPTEDFAAWPERALYTQGWDVYGLYVLGKEILENCLFCPRTTAMLRSLPGLVNAGFSRLMPQTRIHPHTGYSDTVWRLHLGLDIPPDCGLRVNGDVQSWQPGQCLAFDDTLRHDAWNYGPSPRTILLVDVLKSEGQP